MQFIEQVAHRKQRKSMADRLSGIDAPNIAPGVENAPDPKDFEFYYDQAREICRRVKHKAHLTDDEIIVLAVVASQLALGKFIAPGERDSDATLNQIMTYLDHDEVIAAISSKMDRLLEGQSGPMREDAPSLKKLSINLNDPEEPSGD